MTKCELKEGLKYKDLEELLITNVTYHKFSDFDYVAEFIEVLELSENTEELEDLIKNIQTLQKEIKGTEKRVMLPIKKTLKIAQKTLAKEFLLAREPIYKFRNTLFSLKGTGENKDRFRKLGA